MVVYVKFLVNSIGLTMVFIILCGSARAEIPNSSSSDLYLLYTSALQHDPEMAAASVARNGGRAAGACRITSPTISCG